MVGSLLAVVASNRRLAASLRIGTLQQIVTEMNTIRAARAMDPEFERSVFPQRADWDDDHIRTYLLAVELANILEWAYLARRDNLLDEDVWESWAETWRAVILSSDALRDCFTTSVWTFGRSEEVSTALNEFVQGAGAIRDPKRSGKNRKHKTRNRKRKDSC